MLSTGGEITPVDGFSLSVAGYVVKVKVWKFNYKEMCKNQRKIRPFSQ